MTGRLHGMLMLVLVIGLLSVPELPAAEPPEKQAESLLNSARVAFNAGQLSEAGKQFRSLLEKFANTPSAQHARYGLGLVLTRSPQSDLSKAVEFLTPPANDGGFPDRGFALYLLAVCHRRDALAELDKPAPTPAAIEQQRKTTEPKWNEALRRFHEARDWFASKQLEDWSGRARCDAAEILLRLNRHREARSVCEPFVKDEKFAENPHRAMGLYYYGLCCFVDGQRDEAGQTLNQIAPFDQPGFGTHAEYLVGRLLHLSEEKDAASVHYDAVLTEFEKQKAAAIEAGKTPIRPPEYVAAASFYRTCLKQESGQFADALGLWDTFATEYPGSPLLPDATLHRGVCLVQRDRFADAEKQLEPLISSTPRLADQALYWLGTARLNLALRIDKTNKAERDGKLNAALEQIRQSADRANQQASTDPEARPRRHEMLFGYAAALEKVERFRDAGQVFEQLWNEQAMPGQRDRILQRMISAYGLAGDGRSDSRGEEFYREFRESILLPDVRYRLAQNAFARAEELDRRNDRNQHEELEKRYHEAADKFAEVATQYPESRFVDKARHAAGICYGRLHQFDRANDALSHIAATDRLGELSVVDLLQAECLIGLSARHPIGHAERDSTRERLTRAEQLLRRYSTSSPQSPDRTSALLWLGHCCVRLGEIADDAETQTACRKRARTAFDQLIRDYAEDRAAGYAALERAKLQDIQGESEVAAQELRQYLSGGKQVAFVAPLAAIQLATQLRVHGQIVECEKVLAEARTKFEPALANDRERFDWVHLLRFHHAVALRASARWNESRPLFDRVCSEARGLPVAVESALQAVHCNIGQARERLTTGNVAFQAAKDDNQRNAASRMIHEARNELHRAADELQNRSAHLRSQYPDSEARVRMSYDAAWCYRELIQAELEESWKQLRQQVARREAEELLRTLPPRTQLPTWPLPDVPRQDVPIQPFERRAQAAYQAVIDEFPTQTTSVEARLELADLLTTRDEHAAAIEQLQAALDTKTRDHPIPPDTRERVHLKLGQCLAAMGQFVQAYDHYHAVANGPEYHNSVAARIHASACLIQADKPAEAAELLATTPKAPGNPFTDSILLRRSQACLKASQWPAARTGFEQFLDVYGKAHPWVDAARYGLALVEQNAGRLDEAITLYRAITTAAPGRLAAMAQVRIGQCRLAQDRPAEAVAELLIAAAVEPGSDVAHVAVLEAARACTTSQHPAQAAILLTRLLADVPVDSNWAQAARERLTQLPQ